MSNLKDSTSRQVFYGIIKWLHLDTGGTGETALLPELVMRTLYTDLGAGARREKKDGAEMDTGS